MPRHGRNVLDPLLAFGDPVRGLGWNPLAPPEPGLSPLRTRALLDALGAPDRAFVCVLVAGTKGKGSTAVFLASALDAAGVRAGLYTSPHLQELRERIRVGGALLPPAALAAGVDRVLGAADELSRGALSRAGPPSAFELLTALALDRFAAARCRVAVLEVGLGGRYDATNAVEPALSLITPISRDHTALLGTTLARIAAEKAGIMRPDRPALIALQRPSALRALRRECHAVRARCRLVPPLGPDARLSLAGAHQRQNAALAAAAAAELSVEGFAVDYRAIARGLARVRWPGRFEVVVRSVPVILDGAHNDGSAAALAATLRETYPRARVHLVLGINRDKDARAVVRRLRAVAATVITTASRSPRALAPTELARIAGDASLAANVAEAIASAVRRARTTDVVCITGSLALVGEAREALGLRAPSQLW